MYVVCGGGGVLMGRSCEITAEGAKALAAGLGGLPSLVTVNLG